MTFATLESDFGVELPTTIPGTKLSIAETYNDSIMFRGAMVQVKDIRIQDVVNNLNEFVEQILPKLYSHVTVSQILDTAQTTIFTDLGYPALVDKMYNVGSAAAPVYKSLPELTIDEALAVVSEYYSHDNLTVQGALDAFGVALLPEPAAGETDIYADLRVLKVKDLTTDILTEKITGEILKDLVDLSAYDFTNSAEFDATSIKNLGNFMLTIQLGQFVTLDGVIKDELVLAEPQFANIAGTTKLSEIKNTIKNLKINQIFSATDVSAIEANFAGAGEMTVAEFLAGKAGDFATLTGVDCSVYGGYVGLIGTATAATWLETIDTAETFDLLGGADNVTPIAGLCDITLKDITESENAVNLLLENFGTLGDLVASGEQDNGIFAIISDVSIQDLLNDPANAITDKLKSSDKTLATLLGQTAGGNEIINTVMAVTVGNLFINGGAAITDSLSTKTFGQLLNITDTDGLMSFIKNVSFGDLMGGGNSAKYAILDALTTRDNGGVTENITLGEFLNIGADASGVLAKMANVSMASLLGNSTTTANPSVALNDVINGLQIKDVFGEYNSDWATSNKILDALYNQTYKDNNPATRGTMLVNDIFENVGDIKLSVIITDKPKVLNLISNYDDLTINTIGDMEIKADITIQNLLDAGVIVEPEGANWSAAFKAKSIQQILNDAAKLA